MFPSLGAKRTHTCLGEMDTDPHGALQFIRNALRLVLIRQDIAQVINRLARAVDRRDKDLVDACFHEDATDDHGIFKGTARARFRNGSWCSLPITGGRNIVFATN